MRGNAKGQEGERVEVTSVPNVPTRGSAGEGSLGKEDKLGSSFPVLLLGDRPGTEPLPSLDILCSHSSFTRAG